MKILILGMILGILVSPSAHAEENLDLSNLQIGLTGATQGGGFSLGAMGRYLPEFKFNPQQPDQHWSVGADLGLTSFNNNGSSAFVVIEYGAFVAYRFSSVWDFRWFAGAQTWTEGNGTAFFTGPEAIYHFQAGALPLGIDGVFVAYEPVFQSTFANLVSAGIHFKF